MFTFFLLTVSLFLIHSRATLQIVPGATWTASGTDQHVQAHGGGIIEVDNVFYWIGENHSNGCAFQSINCYSSTDLVNWAFVNELLTLQPSGDLGPNRVVERPHVIFNDATGTYVMWMHIDDTHYREAKAGVAISDTVCGKYTYLGASQPLGFQSRDENVFKDTDGTAYLLTEDRSHGLRINRLSADYLSVDSPTFLYSKAYEAPAMFKSGDGTYFMFASLRSGWNPNDNLYSTATSISGPWSDWAHFATAGSNTFNSQTTAIVSINGVIMFMGDRWNSKNLMASTYVWLPLTISGTTATLTNQVNWILDIPSGTWTSGPTETSPEAEASTNTLTNGAKILACTGCSGSKVVGWLGGPPNGSVTFNNIKSSAVTTGTTLRVHYTNADSTPRYATVLVNGITARILAFVPTTNDKTPASSALTVPLQAGDTNVITFFAHADGWAPNIDRIMVPVESPVKDS